MEKADRRFAIQVRMPYLSVQTQPFLNAEQKQLQKNLLKN
ncbi:MAG: hypothetical protein AVDCRST_MAG96-2776 [uncultured Segetibacter sp.]|uniref:Uncharacterized protein n=1 Tax=uncultured Segetibacter sp. TaxID=481133 RepID=A0A6J4TAJ0_9BACT|nr:MAG: hypothetical protein AVDCRST_MAG96-2776 [uncultured Segetibacter sp.]